MRTPARQLKPRIARMATFPAPTGGWVANQNLAQPAKNVPQGAFMLQNIFPTATGAVIRRGTQKFATIGAGSLPVDSLMSYKNGNAEKLFGATANAIYDISAPANPNVSPAASVSGLGSGDWISAQFATTGGVYLVNVNAVDNLQLFDGTAWWALTNQPINRLNFDAQTANFNVGATITGGTSGSTAVISSMVDNGATGYLILGTISGAGFQDNEIITGSSGGSATVDGTAIQLFIPITGIATSSLSYVWPFKGRLFFIEENSMNAWYLPADAVGGALTKFPLGGEFTLGGSLMFGASWSLDAGNGLHDTCAFFSTEGEVLIYDGTDPTTWTKVGIYRIGKPRGPKAYIRAGGDLVIATDVGFVPLSNSIQRDYAALSPSAVSYPIETEWNAFVRDRPSTDWNCEIWPEAQMVVVALPTGIGQTPTMLVSNARTGAWSEYTGWDGNCLELFDGRLFFGSQNGKVMEANVTGADDGVPYTGIYIPLFDDLKSPASMKTALMARAFIRSPVDTAPSVDMQFDYAYEPTPAPSSAVIPVGAQWGVGIWGVSSWSDTPLPQAETDWVSAGGAGYAMAPQVQLTSGYTVPLDAEIVRIEITYDLGDIVT